MLQSNWKHSTDIIRRIMVISEMWLMCPSPMWLWAVAINCCDAWRTWNLLNESLYMFLILIFGYAFYFGPYHMFFMAFVSILKLGVLVLYPNSKDWTNIQVLNQNIFSSGMIFKNVRRINMTLTCSWMFILSSHIIVLYADGCFL